MGKIRIKGWCVSFLICIFLPFFSYNKQIEAQQPNQGGPKVLVIFSSKNEKIDEHQRMLDLLLSHYSSNISFRSTKDVIEEDLKDIEYLFYYGHYREVIPKEAVSLISSFQGTVVSIGYNFEQLDEKYHFIKQLSDQVNIDQIILNNNQNDKLNIQSKQIVNLQLVDKDHTKVLVWGKDGTNQYPLFVQNNQTFYLASNELTPPLSFPFAEILHDVFDTHHRNHEKQYGYIRLEDIHPLVDPEPLMEIAKLLDKKNIPYMIAVIPVYTNPITKKQYHFSDSPKLLKTLKYMQDHGGSIVLHGYTHQFRQSETGEGFEFWDVDYNMPIYHHHDEDVKIKSRHDFNNDEEFEQYLQRQKEFEKTYIERKLVNGIEELANFGLYPLAFEAPHYTMSQHGYKVISQFFSTYVGQVQLSDKDWRIMHTAPYITSPQFLHGMMLLPETIGYVNDEQGVIDEMMNEADPYLFVRDGMIAGFYHPYLGVERFKELLTRLERLPNIEWIDLKQYNNHVKTERVKITSNNGEIIVDIHRFKLFQESFEYLDYHLKNFMNLVFWVFAGIGAFGILSFVLCILKVHLSTNRSSKRGGVIG